MTNNLFFKGKYHTLNVEKLETTDITMTSPAAKKMKSDDRYEESTGIS